MEAARVDQSADKHEHHFEPRVEDDALIRGRGRFVEDAPQPNQAYAVFVRSPHAHARITSIDVEAARAAARRRGGADAPEMDAAGVGSTSVHPPLVGRDGKKLVDAVPPRAGARARDACRASRSRWSSPKRMAQAQDAAELVAVDYEELPAVADLRAAISPGAPQLCPEAPGNIALDWPGPVPNDGSQRARDRRIFGQAAHVAQRRRCVNQRLVVATMEPRGATARYDAATDRYTLRSCSQGADPQREQLIAMMGLPREKLRVITEDVGGAFGLKTPAYPEYPALLVAAKLTGRPVAWMSTRSEAFLTDQQARDTITEAELALDAKGKFLALRVQAHRRHGRLHRHAGREHPDQQFLALLSRHVRDPAHRRSTCNACSPTRCRPGPIAAPGGRRRTTRWSGWWRRPRASPASIRSGCADAISSQPKQIPYKTAVGTTYDSGDFAPILDKALALAHYAEFKKRRRESFRRRKLRGIGVSCFLEHAGAMPTESASLLFPGDGKLVLGIGVQNTGQGHATVYPRLVGAKLGIPATQIVHRHGDTDLDLKGNPSVGSRSTMTVGSALYRAVDLMLEKAKPIAAGMLEAADTDIVVSRRAFRSGRHRPARVAVRGRGAARKQSGDTPRHQGDGRHAADLPERLPHRRGRDRSRHRRRRDRRLCGGGRCRRRARPHARRGPARRRARAGHRPGADGERRLRRRQRPARHRHVHGLRDAARQSTCRRSPMPSHNVPATTNPLGVKGVGEAGTTGSIAAIMNAIANAIPDGRGVNIDMPATPAKVWRACNAGT